MQFILLLSWKVGKIWVTTATGPFESIEQAEYYKKQTLASFTQYAVIPLYDWHQKSSVPLDTPPGRRVE